MGKTVLVVDDSMLIRHTVCRWLEERGFVVHAACNGLEALQILADLPPDLAPHLIITDLQMPRMTGPELIAQLKRRSETAAIPVVVLASKQSCAEAAYDPHVCYTIYKDIDVNQQLELAIAGVLGEELLVAAQ